MRSASHNPNVAKKIAFVLVVAVLEIQQKDDEEEGDDEDDLRFLDVTFREVYR